MCGTRIISSGNIKLCHMYVTKLQTKVCVCVCVVTRIKRIKS